MGVLPGTARRRRSRQNGCREDADPRGALTEELRIEQAVTVIVHHQTNIHGEVHICQSNITVEVYLCHPEYGV